VRQFLSRRFLPLLERCAAVPVEAFPPPAGIGASYYDRLNISTIAISIFSAENYRHGYFFLIFFYTGPIFLVYITYVEIKFHSYPALFKAKKTILGEGGILCIND